MKNPVIVIAGPTASGKTAMAIELAKKFNGEIVNADSRSVYVGMDIGTGKPAFSACNPEEQIGDLQHKDLNQKKITASSFTEEAPSNDVPCFEGVPHHLFDVVNPDEPFTLMDYKKLAQRAIAEIRAKGKIPFLVGGTGLYIDAVVYDFEPVGNPNPEFRKELEHKDPELLYGMLLTFDPETAKTIDPRNTRRVIRALEVYEQTKEGKIKQEKQKPKPENILYLAIDIDREKLYDKINRRIDDWQKDNGLVEETKKLIAKYPIDLPSMSSIGYTEIAQALDQKISLAEALEIMKKRTRNYAKRQLTWFRRNPDIKWVSSIEEAQKEISKFLKN